VECESLDLYTPRCRRIAYYPTNASSDDNTVYPRELGNGAAAQ
jgi:hypothetical protein